MTPIRKDGEPWEACCLCMYLTDGVWEGVAEGDEYCYLDLQIVSPTEGVCKAFQEVAWLEPDVTPLTFSAHEKAAALALKSNTYSEETDPVRCDHRLEARMRHIHDGQRGL